MIFGGGFIGFLGLIMIIRLLAQIRDQGAPVRYAPVHDPSGAGLAFFFAMLGVVAWLAYHYQGPWTVAQ